MHPGYVEQYHKTGTKRVIGIPRTMLGKKKDGTTFALLLNLGEVDSNDEKYRFMAVIRPAVSEARSRKPSLVEDITDASSALKFTEIKLIVSEMKID